MFVYVYALMWLNKLLYDIYSQKKTWIQYNCHNICSIDKSLCNLHLILDNPNFKWKVEMMMNIKGLQLKSINLLDLLEASMLRFVVFGWCQSVSRYSYRTEQGSTEQLIFHSKIFEPLQNTQVIKLAVNRYRTQHRTSFLSVYRNQFYCHKTIDKFLILS